MVLANRQRWLSGEGAFTRQLILPVHRDSSECHCRFAAVSPPAIEPSAGSTVFTSMFGEIERTEPSPNAKFSWPFAWKLPQDRLHWLSRPGGVFTHWVKSGNSVRLWAIVTSDSE